MTAMKGKPGRRFSREQQQENLSRAQFEARLSEPEIGWIPSTVKTDMGEDLHVRIYDRGVSTGLSFDVQLKSTADSERLKKKKTGALAYPLEVKDLLHWEVSTTLVVLVVWDVEERAGWWRSIPAIVEQLDAKTKTWRDQKTITVSVPRTNGTDRKGLVRLRCRVADHNLPIASSSQEMRCSLTFDRTEQGIAAFRELKRAVDMGEPLVLADKLAPKIKFPDWYRRIYDLPPAVQLDTFGLGAPLLSKVSLAVRIEIESPGGRAEYPYVELYPVTQGAKLLVLTNEQQSLPLVFRFAFDLIEESLSLSFEQKRPGRAVYEALGAAAFMAAVATPGAVIRVTHPDGTRFLPPSPSPRILTPYDLNSIRHRRDVLEKLWYIQQRVVDVGAFLLEDEPDFSQDDVLRIDSLFDICRSGRIETTMSISFNIPPGFDERGALAVVHRQRTVSLLGIMIPLGDMRVTVLNQSIVTDAIQKARLEADALGNPVTVSLEDLPILQEYVEWLPGNLPWAAMYETLDRLGESAVLSEGYVTRSDARAAGATDAIFDALLGETKIEQVASGVFRLLHFPCSDHEELISLWLQTDRKGILSHDTALLINAISDILPRRRHITVPPGWEPGGRQLDADVVLYYAEVGKDEIRWLGPIPYTAPLRTVRDCIAAHLSPDLIEQAIADGLRRGMFTEADLPPDARRGAA